MHYRTVTLTGGTGFLGFHLVPALKEAGYEVRVMRRPQDFADDAALERACRGADAVIHAAGLVSYALADQKLMQETHVGLTRRMLAAARRAGVIRFVHVSSIVTVGHGKVPRDESSAYNSAPLKLPYFDTKTEAEQVALAANAPGFEVVAVNPGSLLGPGEKNGQLLPFVRKLARAERPFLPDGGSDFLDARDAARGTVLALERGRPGERYILGSENLSYADFHARLRACFGKRSRPRVVPRPALSAVETALRALEAATGLDLPVNSPRLRRVNGVFMFHDLSKARRELGYEPRPIDEALTAMLEEEGV